MSSAQAIAQDALALAAQGHDAKAQALFTQGLARFPDDARFANSAGNFHSRAGRALEALDLFERAFALSPDFLEAAINAAITAIRLDQPERAATILRGFENNQAIDGRYWRIRGDAERAAKLWHAASLSTNKAIALEPGNPKTARSRARLALERNDPRVLEHHERALALNPGDPNLLHDYAQALALDGRLDEALEYTAAIVQHLPDWTDGLTLHAELRWAKGDEARFADHFETAAATAAASPQIMLAWSNVLDGVDRHAESAIVLGRARERFTDVPQLALAQAVALGEAGQAEAAQIILDQHNALQDRDWTLVRARNRLRLGDAALAQQVLGEVLASHPADVDAWALIDLCWRTMNDPRSDWLHGQYGLVRQIALPLDPAELADITGLLGHLHATCAPPIGQSVKIGTQTKGALFARAEPELARLEAALHDVLEEYRAGLAPYDARHPLLSRRQDRWQITGSWSIRLDGKGHHAAHIHPKGCLSSASYYSVSPEVEEAGHPGWLELGRPPAGLADGLGPLHEVKPVAGTCVLFPSTLYHGTRPISKGTRMTVAFDVSAGKGL